jgi:hypothetical protein
MIKDALFLYRNDGVEWKRHRQIIQQSFGPELLRLGTVVSIEKVELLVKVFDTAILRDDGILDAHEATSCFSLDVIGAFAFRYEFNCLSDFMSKVPSTIYHDMELMTKVMEKRALIPSLLWRLTNVHESKPELVQLRNNLEKTVRSALDAR